MTRDSREIAQRIFEIVDNEWWKTGVVEKIETILAAEMPRWVPVAEKLPRDFERVICFDETAVRDRLVPEIEIRYEVSSYSGHFWNCGHLSNVTHWQYLPSPPREEAP